MKLLYTVNSPYARKVRIVAAEKHIDIKLEEVVLSDPDCPVKLYNPLGKVPVLVLPDNDSLYDSRVIAEYVDTLSPVSQLIPKTGRDRAAAKCWEALADGTLDAAIIIIKEQQRPQAQQSQEWIERQYGKIHAALKAREADLGNKNFCMGVNFSLADVAVGCAVGYLDFRFPHLDWRTESPNLDRLYTKLSQRQSFQDTQPPKQ